MLYFLWIDRPHSAHLSTRADKLDLEIADTLKYRYVTYEVRYRERVPFSGSRPDHVQVPSSLRRGAVCPPGGDAVWAEPVTLGHARQRRLEAILVQGAR